MAFMNASFRIHYCDGSSERDNDTFDRFSHAITRAGEWLEYDDTITRIDVHDIDVDGWPIIATVTTPDA